MGGPGGGRVSTALHWLALAFYIGATVVYLAFVISQRRGFFRMGRLILWIGWVLHTAAIAVAWVELGPAGGQPAPVAGPLLLGHGGFGPAVEPAS